VGEKYRLHRDSIPDRPARSSVSLSGSPGGWVGPRAGMDGRKNLVPTGIRLQTVQPPSSVAIPTELPGHMCIYTRIYIYIVRYVYIVIYMYIYITIYTYI